MRTVARFIYASLRAAQNNGCFATSPMGDCATWELDRAHTLTLAEARDRATEARKLRLDGIDPIASKRARVAALASCRCQRNDVQAMRRGIHPRQREKVDEPDAPTRSGRTYARPTPSTQILGSLPVAAIDTPLVLRVLKPLWERTPETASRVRGRIENVLGWATVHHYRSGDNPAKWNGPLLEHALPARNPGWRRSNTLPPCLMPRLPRSWRGCGRRRGVAARCLEFVLR